jgi:hypothetical protein
MSALPTVTAIAETDQTTRAIAVAKWGRALDAGFQIIPNVLIRAQTKLDLDPLDLAILLNIGLHWWTPHDLPYPRTSVIANRVGVSMRTVERRLEKMQASGLIVRHPPEKTKDGLSVRWFDLRGLVERLEAFAQANLEMRQRGYYYDNNDNDDSPPLPSGQNPARRTRSGRPLKLSPQSTMSRADDMAVYGPGGTAVRQRRIKGK